MSPQVRQWVNGVHSKMPRVYDPQAFSSTDAKVARENGVRTGPDLARAGGVVAPSAVADELCDGDVAGDVRPGWVLEFKLAADARLHQIAQQRDALNDSGKILALRVRSLLEAAKVDKRRVVRNAGTS